MTRIDFYILAEAGMAARHAFACKLVHKIAAMGHRIYLHCADEQQARQLDELLWQLHGERFLPHRLIDDGGAPCPVEIGYAGDPARHDDLLINLAGEIAPFFSRFHRLCEIVSQDPPTLAATRANYRFYKDRHYPLHNHDLRRGNPPN